MAGIPKHSQRLVLDGEELADSRLLREHQGPGGTQTTLQLLLWEDAPPLEQASRQAVCYVVALIAAVASAPCIALAALNQVQPSTCLKSNCLRTQLATVPIALLWPIKARNISRT